MKKVFEVMNKSSFTMIFLFSIWMFYWLVLCNIIGLAIMYLFYDINYLEPILKTSIIAGFVLGAIIYGFFLAETYFNLIDD